MFDERRRAKLIFRSALFLLLAYYILVSIRLTSAPMHSWGLFFIFATTSVLAGSMFLAWRHIAIRFAAYLLIVGILFLVILRAVVAGGTDSPIIIITILAPMSAMFLLGRKDSLVVASLAIAAVIVLVLMRINGYEYPSLLLDDVAFGVVQSSVVIFVLLVSTWIAWLYASENEVLQTELRALTHRDHLTGIANRRAFDEMIEKEVFRARRAGTPLTLLMVDIDYFKKFNDRYGHTEGDECLIKVATIIKACLRRAGDMVARYGGEELVIVLPETELENARGLAETIRHAVAGLNIAHEDTEYGMVTITIGASTYLQGVGDTALEMVKRADEALYEGKKSGRNRICCHPESSQDKPAKR